MEGRGSDGVDEVRDGLLVRAPAEAAGQGEDGQEGHEGNDAHGSQTQEGPG